MIYWKIGMYVVKMDVFRDPDFKGILEAGERLLWSGSPEYGREFFEATGHEKTMYFALAAGALLMWSSLPLIGDDTGFGRTGAIWTYSCVTVFFALFAVGWASHRQTILSNLAYFITDRRAIVCRRARNWHLSTRVYVISCPHSETFPYSVLPTRPHASLQIGILLSEDVVQPFGHGLSHSGQPILQGRITEPDLFEQGSDAERLRQTVLSYASKDSV